MSASTQCPHTDVHYHLNLVAFGDSNVRYVEIRGHCNICAAPMRFRGGVLGMTPDRPTVALDGAEARLPVMFGDEEYDGRAAGFVGSVTHG